MAILFPVKREMAILFFVKRDLDPPFTTLNVVFSYSKFCFEQQFTENLEHVFKCIV